VSNAHSKGTTLVSELLPLRGSRHLSYQMISDILPNLTQSRHAGIEGFPDVRTARICASNCIRGSSRLCEPQVPQPAPHVFNSTGPNSSVFDCKSYRLWFLMSMTMNTRTASMSRGSVFSARDSGFLHAPSTRTRKRSWCPHAMRSEINGAGRGLATSCMYLIWCERQG